MYVAYAVFVTWPLATNLSRQLSAPNLLEDAAGTAAYFADLVNHHMSPFSAGHIPVLNAPQGLPVTWQLNLAQAPSYLMIWVLVLVFGPIAGSNIFMLLGFVLSGITMFAIIHRLFGSRIVAVLAGFVFAFYPFAVAASGVHYAFVHGWPLLLGVWRLLEMVHEPTRRNALLAGAATAFAMWWNPYFELLGGFALMTCLVICIALGHARGETGRASRASLTAILPVAALGMFFVILLKVGGTSSVGTVTRPISQVYAFSAHLRDYLPGPYSLLFGRITRDYLISHLGIADTWDTALYPGYVVLVLAVAGLVAVLRTRRTDPALLSNRRAIVVLTAGALAVVAFVSSGTPTVSVLGVTVWLPSDALYHLTPTWQTFTRFVILMEIALIFMMGAALTRLRRSLPTPRLWLAFTLIGLLLVVDLWDRQPQRTASTSPPAAYAWLRTHQGGIVADYPLLPANDSFTALSAFWGAYDRHPLLDGYAALSPDESMKLDLADLRDPQTAGKLAGYGVRYIVVHAGTPGGNRQWLRAQGYHLIIGDRGPALWRVTSPPAHTMVDAASGFGWYWGFPSYDKRRLLHRGTLALRARGCSSNCTGTVSFSVAGIGGAVRLIVRDGQNRAVLTSVRVRPKNYVRVRIPDMRVQQGHLRLRLQVSPARRGVVLLTRTARLVLRNR
jgi:hypothetical protein